MAGESQGDEGSATINRLSGPILLVKKRAPRRGSKGAGLSVVVQRQAGQYRGIRVEDQKAHVR